MLVFSLKSLFKAKAVKISPTNIGISTTLENEQTNTQEVLDSKINNRNIIIVKGLGIVSINKLKESANIIEKFYGLKTEIQANIDISNDMYFNNSDTLDGDVCLKNIRESIKTVYITNHPLKGSNLDLRGYTYLNGSVVIVKTGAHLKETIIHEIGHTFGLDDCEDMSCILAINNDEYDSGDFCANCKPKLQFLGF
jgi:hypothetical protein